jgi:hypothetical protein
MINDKAMSGRLTPTRNKPVAASGTYRRLLQYLCLTRDIKQPGLL